MWLSKSVADCGFDTHLTGNWLAFSTNEPCINHFKNTMSLL